MSTAKVHLGADVGAALSIIVNAKNEQQIFLEAKRTNGTELLSATFEGQGERVYAKNVSDSTEQLFIGPFHFEADIFIVIRYKTGGLWRESKLNGPFATPGPFASGPKFVSRIETVTSEDPVDKSRDDCIVQIFLYSDKYT